MSCSIFLLPLELLVIPITLPIEIAKEIAAEKRQTRSLERIKETESKLEKQKNTTTKEAPTIFTDYGILFETLDEYGAHPFSIGNGNIKCSIDNCDIKFIFTDKQYYVRLNEDNYHLVEKYLSNIYDSYRKNVQENTYNKIKENLKSKQMKIEKEEILEDDSIVLTVNV